MRHNVPYAGLAMAVTAFTAIVVSCLLYEAFNGSKTNERSPIGSIVQYTGQLSGKYILISGNDSRIVTCTYSVPAGDGKLTHLYLGCIVPVAAGTAGN